jgi:hypothetical protein
LLEARRALGIVAEPLRQHLRIRWSSIAALARS